MSKTSRLSFVSEAEHSGELSPSASYNDNYKTASLKKAPSAKIMPISKYPSTRSPSPGPMEYDVMNKSLELLKSSPSTVKFTKTKRVSTMFKKQLLANPGTGAY